MPIHSITLTLAEPFTCSHRPVVSNEIGTLHYIPATVIRGALFTALVRAGRTGDVEKWLGVGKRPTIRYSPAWPIAKGIHAVPMPLCFVNDKGDSGLGGKRGAMNVLWCDTLPAMDGAHRLQWTRPSQEWLMTDRKGDPVKGYSLDEIEPHMHVGLHYQRQASRKGALFSRSVIPAGTAFRFLVDYSANPLKDFPTTIFMGKRRSAGNGAASTAVDPTLHSGYAAGKPSPDEVLIQFMSDCLIPSADGGWETGLGRKEWSRLLDSPVDQVMARSVHREVFGWSTVWGRPREQATAIKAGSCFRITAKNAAGKFAEWERSGFGTRTEEGFGWIAVNPAWLFAGQDGRVFGKGESEPPTCIGQPPLAWPGLENVNRKAARGLIAMAIGLKSEAHARKLAELASLAARSSQMLALTTYVANMANRPNDRGWKEMQTRLNALRVADITELRFVLSSAATLSRKIEEQA
jgi:hypothetical protein